MKKTILLAVLLLLPEAVFAHQKILVLHSYHRGYEWTRTVDAGMADFLARELPAAELFVEEMDTKRHAPERLFPRLRNFYAQKYADTRFDIILCSDDNALDFLLAHRDALFPGVPVVFCGINNFSDERIAGHWGFTGVTEAKDYAGTLEIALQLHPDTRQVALVSDLTPSSLANLELLRQVKPRFAERVDFVELVGLEGPDLERALRQLPAEAIVLHLDYFRDAAGRYYTVPESNALLSQQSKRPVYACTDFKVRDGVLGGLVVSGRQQGETAARMSKQILTAKPPQIPPVVRRSPNVYMFDYQALQRLGIDRESLPAGSVIRNDPDRRYREQQRQLWLSVAAAGAFAVLALALGIAFNEKRLASKALRRSEDRFRSLVETANDWIWEVDSSGRYTYASIRVYDLLGYEPQEVLGKTPFDLMPPAEAERIAKEFERIVAGRQPFYLLKNVNLHRDGREVVLETSGAPFFDDNGNLIGYRGIDRDITDRQKAEESLHMALHGLDSSISGITMADLGGTLTYANDAFQAMWGAASPYEFIGQPAFELWENTEQAQTILPALSTSGTWSGELTGARRDGERFVTQASAFLVRNLEGKPLCLMGAYIDITDRKAAVRALRESESKLNAMLQSIADPVIMMDPSLTVLWANGTAKGLFGADLVGKRCFETIHGRTAPCAVALCGARRCFEEGVLQEDEQLWISPAGEQRFFQCTTNVALRDSDGRVTAVLKIGRDITARKQAQEQLHLAKYAMDSSLAPITMADLQGRVTYANKAFLDMGGYSSAEEILGRDAMSFYCGPTEDSTTLQALEEQGEWRGEIQTSTKDGSLLELEVLSCVVRNPAGEPLAKMASLLDVTEKKKAEREIRRLAYFDDLTELPNRTLLKDHMDLAFAGAERAGKSAALLLLDLDNFKQINDTLGHAKGDLLLQQVARRLRGELRKGDTLARWGGDEFVLLLPDVQDENAVASIARKILELLNEHPYDLEGSEIFSSASIGITLFPQNGRDTETLLKHADNAMYEAKRSGRNDYHFFSERMHRKAAERQDLEGRLRRALRQEEFSLVYQPQIDMHSGRPIGMEALVRWQDPEEGLVSPGDFIPLAEDTGLIRPLGEWILRSACHQAVSWQGTPCGPLRIAVNVSAQQFCQPDLARNIEQVLQETGLNPCLLELELTETVFMENMQAAIEVLVDLKELGIQVAIDDFGTGYSSLSYLKNFPIDRIKIAQEFVRDIPADPNDMAIVSATVAMARSLGLKLIAEGVETREQLEFLWQLGCEEMQGYYFSRPLAADQVADFCGQGFCSTEV